MNDYINFALIAGGVQLVCTIFLYFLCRPVHGVSISKRLDWLSRRLDWLDHDIIEYKTTCCMRNLDNYAQIEVSMKKHEDKYHTKE